MNRWTIMASTAYCSGKSTVAVSARISTSAINRPLSRMRVSRMMNFCIPAIYLEPFAVELKQENRTDIAERMQSAKLEIPHFAYVEEIEQLDEWIRSRTGIEERHVAADPKETTATLATEQGRWQYVLMGIGGATIALQVWIIVEAVLMLPRAKGVLEEALPPLDRRPSIAATGGRSC